jgi:hypothetical protein
LYCFLIAARVREANGRTTKVQTSKSTSNTPTTEDNTEESDVCPAFGADFSTRGHLTALVFNEDQRLPERNYGFRDDNAVRITESHVRVQTGGCPGHEVFQDPLSDSSSESDDSLRGYSESRESHGKFTPNFHVYDFAVPKAPVVAPSGPTSLRSPGVLLHDETHGDPFGNVGLKLPPNV